MHTVGDRWARATRGKLEGLLAFPLIALGVLVLLKVLPRLDPLRERYAEFAIGTPWTLSSERAWIATHRVARWVSSAWALLVVAGVLQTPWLLARVRHATMPR